MIIRRSIGRNNRFWKYFTAGCLLAAIAAAAFLLASPPGTVRPTLAQTEADKTRQEILAVVPANFPPQYQVDKNGKPYGFAIDVIEELAKRIGLRVIYRVEEIFPKAMLTFRAGTGDIIPNVGITEDRAQYGNFTRPVETFDIRLFVRETTQDITEIADLEGRKTGAVAENMGVRLLRKQPRDPPLKVFDSLAEALLGLLAGDVDAIAYPEPVLKSYAESLGLEDRIKVVGKSLIEIKRGVFVRKDAPELLARLDGAVKDFVSTPEFQRIYSKWHGKPVAFWTASKVGATMGLVLLVVVMVGAIWWHFRVLAFNREIVATNRDLLEARDRLALTETRFQRLAESLPVAVIRTDAEGNGQYVNAAWTKLTGQAMTKAEGDGWRQVFAANDREKIFEGWKISVPARPYKFECKIEKADADPQWVLIQAEPERHDGEVLGYIAVLHDIDEIKRGEIALAASEHRFELAMRGANDGLWDWDLLTQELYLSPRWKSMLGYAPEEFPDRYEEWENRIHPDDREKALAAVKRCLDGIDETLKVEFRLAHKNGSYVDILARGFAECDEQGNPIRFVGTHTDNTLHKQEERALHLLLQARETMVRGNAALIQITDEQELLDEMCRILVEVGKYPLAWVGYALDDPNKNVHSMAKAGTAASYLDGMIIHWGEDEYSHGATGTAIREGSVQVIDDIDAAAHYGPWQEQARRLGLRSSIALPLKAAEKTFGAMNVYASTPDAFDEDRVRMLKELADDLAYGLRMIQVGAANKAFESRYKGALLQMIQAIALTVEKRDPYTAGHQQNVAILAVAVARKLGWDETRIEGLRLGSMIHDIGKISIPAEILNRSGKLSEHEFGIIKAHPSIGLDIVQGIDFPWPIREMISQHHERLDGSGYPLGLKGDKIVPEARIIAVADVVEAITAHRPYRPALGIEFSLEELKKGRGKIFDAAIVDACIELIKIDGFRWDDISSTGKPPSSAPAPTSQTGPESET